MAKIIEKVRIGTLGYKLLLKVHSALLDIILVYFVGT